MSDVSLDMEGKRTTRRQLLAAGLGLGATVAAMPLLAACGGGDSEGGSGDGGSSADATQGTSGTPGTSGDSGSEGEPKYGGKLTMSLADRDVTSFDPIIPTDNMSIWTMVLIYDQLVRNAPDGQSVEPGLAETWEVSDDGLTYTFNLREATFHDGSPVTAEDAVYSLLRAVQEEDSQWGWIYQGVDTVEATDERTVTVKMSHTWAPFLADVALFSSSIIPKKLHEERGPALFDSPVGSGPFQFVSWEKNTSIKLKKWENYWDPERPYLDELEFLVLTDANTRMLKFQAGELDIATDVPFSQLEALEANPNYTILTDGAARFDYIGMNHTRKPFDDKLVRQAINYAIDKEAIIQSVLFGYGEMANTMLPKMLYHADHVEGYPYNLEKAKELMASSSAPDGFTAELIISSGDPVAQQVAQLVQSQLAEIGGTINIRLVEPGSATDDIRALNYDWSKSYYTTDIIDPDELVTFGMVSDGGTKAVWTGYKNEEVDRLAREAAAETDPARREEMYHRIQELTTEDAPVILLYYPTGRTAVQKYIHGFRILPTGNYRLWDVWRSE
ncbi:ABC transporter substrate-binding protein [Sphaerobacter thermophilus]|uniref:ABC transporter substrate-binding protein n=1 Tax=Sphaerobacter thermophilus TaxID=2057 RepID=UPI0039C39738